MRKLIITTLFLYILSQGQAQEAAVLDTIQTEDPSLLMLSLSYTSNNINTKNYEYNRIPALLLDANYFHKNGFTSALNYTNYYHAAENTYEAEIQIGYQKNILPNLLLDTYYARRKFVGDTTYSGLAQKNTLAFNAAYTWKWLDFQVSNSYMNGKSNNYFLDLDVSASIEFENIFSKNDFILINPTISSTFGTDYWVFQDLDAAHSYIVMHFLDRHSFKSQRFEYQSLSVFVPILYNIGNMGIMLNYFYNWPSAKLASLSWANQSGVMLTLYYTPNF